MTLIELRYLVALAEENHFGRAAAACHVSQPTLSIAIKKLEQTLGAALFERTRTGIRTTPLGEQVVAKARRVVAEAAELEDLVESGRDPLVGPLALGTLPSIGPYLLPQFIPLLQKQAAQMPLTLYEAAVPSLTRKLRAGELDAIITSLPFRAADTVVQPLFDEPLVALLPAGHPLAEKTALEPADLQSHEVLLMAEGEAFRDQVLTAFPHLARSDSATGEPLRANVQGSTLETLRHMVASGLGVTILPLTAAQLPFYSSEVVVTRPFISPEPVRTLALAWRTSFPRHRAIDVLRKAVQASSLAYWRYATGRADEASGLLMQNRDW